MADDGPRCELLYPENTRECTHEKGALSRGHAAIRGSKSNLRRACGAAGVEGMGRSWWG